ncbi:hypothetical protein V8G54_010829 [Vigna mungo]|uniref:Flotillin-like n=1 Tax=Vigna mungo TaxID=3915 RepID=A0AAQ3NZL5_VIGMU
MYRVAKASEYLVITGIGIKDIKLAKKAWVFPGQSCTRFELSPVNYTFMVQAMSAEKLPFILPAVFTIGPRVDDEDSLLKYARLLSSHDKLSNHVNELVQGIIEGETRVLAASMTMEDLNQFGLVIYNANVKQLVDVPGHEYFSYLGQKTQMEAANQAKVDVAEGVKEEIKVKTEVKVFENEREAEVAQANSDLAQKKAMWAKTAQVAEVEATKAVAMREAELQREVEKMNALTRTEKLKAEFLSKANVEYETKVQEANWELYRKQKVAEANLFEKEKEAQAQKALAEATYFSKQQAAEAELFAKKKEAEGLMLMGQARGAYLSTLLGALGGNYNNLRDYLMINSGMFQEIAQANAEAIRGLKPKISIWNNGGEGSDSGGGMKDVASVYKMLPPLLNTVHEQTGMLPPAWMGTLSSDTTS